MERSRGTAWCPRLLNYSTGVAEVEPQCSGRNKWLGRREGRQGSHRSPALLLFHTFTIGEKCWYHFTRCPFLTEDEALKRVKMRVCREMCLEVSNPTISAYFQEPSVNAYVPLATAALPVRSARGKVRGTPSLRRQSQQYLGASGDVSWWMGRNAQRWLSPLCPAQGVRVLQNWQIYFAFPLLNFFALMRRWLYFCSSKLHKRSLQLCQNMNSYLIYNPWQASGLLQQLCFLSFSLWNSQYVANSFPPRYTTMHFNLKILLCRFEAFTNASWSLYIAAVSWMIFLTPSSLGWSVNLIILFTSSSSLI